MVLGEYGLLGFDTHIGVVQQGEKLKFFEYMIHYAQEKDIAHMLWDNGQHLNRTTLEWSDEQLYEMMQVSWQTRSATAYVNSLYFKQGHDLQDQIVSLQLNGNQVKAIYAGERHLIEGTDYELNGSNLVFKRPFLEEIIVQDTLGVNEVLTIQFNQGSNWYVEVITYETPQFEVAQGLINTFTIPAQFNGDALKTMEATYPDGRPAGPQDWTTFKEFGYAFSPDYQAKEIQFPNGQFLNALADGEVKLRFHFWSGEEVTYRLLKNGNNVSGFVE